MIEIDRPTWGTLADLIETIDDCDLTGGAMSTGYEILDQALNGGVHPGDVTLIGGGPGVGKTVATLQMARSMALHGIPVAYVCYEHSERSLLARLLLLELGEMGVAHHEVMSASDAIWRVAHGEQRWATEAGRQLVLRAAHSKVNQYAHNLTVIGGTAAFGLEQFAELVDDGSSAVVFVDYLQKIPADNPYVEDRVTSAVEGLKDLALTSGVAVVAVVAGTHAGLEERRLRLRHLRGAESLAYEADVVVMLNEKATSVSRRHSSFDAVRAREFGRWVVFSVEKNRHGPANIDVEFAKDFATFRFVNEGRYVEERLVDGTSEMD